MSNRLAEILISESASIRTALQAIDRGAIDIALVVDGDERLLGTVTDGDIRRALLKGAGLDDPVMSCMSRVFTAVGCHTTRAEVLDLMKARYLEQIPILDERGRVVGLHLLREMVGAVERPNWAVIMAGGRGERLKPLTDSIPKPMIRVAGRPILERIVLHLVGFGIRRIFLAVHYMANVIEEHFGSGAAFGCRFEYLRETMPLGTGGALSLLPAVPDAPLVVLNGDLVTQFDLGQMLRLHADAQHRATVAVHSYVHTVPFGVLDVENGLVARLREKPTHSWLTNAGVYVLDPDLISRVPPETFVTVPGLLDDCVSRGERVGIFAIDDDWIDVGRHHELRRANGEGDPA
jgi:dTDP-glucose pyrophosphorylase/predicted transcriptional regulator